MAVYVAPAILSPVVFADSTDNHRRQDRRRYKNVASTGPDRALSFPVLSKALTA
jgi:hypothetical protein